MTCVSAGDDFGGDCRSEFEGAGLNFGGPESNSEGVAGDSEDDLGGNFEGAGDNFGGVGGLTRLLEELFCDSSFTGNSSSNTGSWWKPNSVS